MTAEALAEPQAYITPEFTITGRHLEAAFFSYAQTYRHNIYEGLGVKDRSAYDALASDERKAGASNSLCQKELQLLQRQPAPARPNEANITNVGDVMAVADTLVRSGMESSIVIPRLNELKKSLAMQRRGPDYDNLRAEQRALKTVVIDCNHSFRDFFVSKTATALGVSSPQKMRQFFAKSSLGTPNSEQINWLARGMSLEIAAKRYLLRVLAMEQAQNRRWESVGLKFGSNEEDKRGGDLVITQDEKMIYIDLKSGYSEIPGLSDEDRLRGYKYQREHGIDKYTVWSESFDAVADDKFRITDSTLKRTLEYIALQKS